MLHSLWIHRGASQDMEEVTSSSYKFNPLGSSDEQLNACLGSQLQVTHIKTNCKSQAIAKPIWFSHGQKSTHSNCEFSNFISHNPIPLSILHITLKEAWSDIVLYLNCGFHTEFYWLKYWIQYTRISSTLNCVPRCSTVWCPTWWGRWWIRG
jgi:hypothetical protein